MIAAQTLVASTEVAARNDAITAFRRARRAARRSRNEGTLAAVRAQRLVTRILDAFQVHGEVCYERQAWLEEAYRLGTSRFCDESNVHHVQLSRLASLSSAAAGEHLDGRRPRTRSLLDVLVLRSKRKLGSQAGADRCRPEACQALPRTDAVSIWKRFA